MSPVLVFGVLAAYFLLLMAIAAFTSRIASNAAFFSGNRKSPWVLVAYGMIGASISGVTLISVTGEVGNNGFSYFQLVLGYPLGYLFIALVLMPMYYRLGLVSIYTYLMKRFGRVTYHTGSALFFVSQSIGASLRLFLAAAVLQVAFFNAFHIPFGITVLATLMIIWLYTYRSGIKTIVWTDTLQTTFMILAVVLSVYTIAGELSMGLSEIPDRIRESGYARVFNFDWQSKHHFVKQFLSGAFIAIVMTGLDQNMMQKNLTCRNLKDARKNMISFSLVLVPVNLLFLALGAMLYMYIQARGLQFSGPSGFYFDPASGLFRNTDELYPLLALNYFPRIAGIFFLLGIIAAAFSSADSAITALTTSFCVDFLKIDGEQHQKQRFWVHIGVSLMMFGIIMLFRAMNDKTVITAVFTIAGYTYGPLLGLFTFGLFTRRRLRDGISPWIAIAAPVICYILSINSEAWFEGYRFGFELLLVNGLISFILLWLFSKQSGSPGFRPS